MGTAVRSRRIAGPVNQLAGTNSVIYTVPAGRTAVIRAITINNANGTTGIVGLHINGTSSSSAIHRRDIPAETTDVVEHVVILNPGDALTCKNSKVTGSVVVTLFGSLLLGEPE